MLETLLATDWAGIAIGALVVIVALEKILPIVLRSVETRKLKNGNIQNGAAGNRASAGERSRTDVSRAVDHRDILEKVIDCERELAALRERTLAMLNKILADCSDLHSWHDVRDADGVFRWMMRAKTEQRIEYIERRLTQIGCPVDTIKDMARQVDEIHQARLLRRSYDKKD